MAQGVIVYYYLAMQVVIVYYHQITQVVIVYYYLGRAKGNSLLLFGSGRVGSSAACALM